MRGGKKRFDYGLILIERLKKAEGEFLDVRRVAKDHGIPGAYLEKIAQEFRRQGWLESRRGLGGGYRLAREPEEVSVGAIINFFERPYEICPITRLQKINIHDS